MDEKDLNIINQEHQDNEHENEVQQAIVNDPTLPDELLHYLIVGDKESLTEAIKDNSAVVIADALNPLPENEVVLFYSIYTADYDKLGEIFSYLMVEKRIALIKNLTKKTLSLVLANVPNDDLADFLEDVIKPVRDLALSMLPKKRQQIIQNLSQYSDDTVGSIMTTEFLTILTGSKVKDIFLKIKTIGKTLETVRTIFIIDKFNHLLGTERLEDLMFEEEDAIIDDVMQRDFPYISPIADREQAIPICQEYDLPVLPVVNKNNEILGILTFDDVMDVLEEENTEDAYRQAGISPTATPYMETKIFKIVRSYVLWLVILLIFNTFTGILVNRFESALITLPILMAFVPSLNDTTGNSASQTSAMVIRSITSGNLSRKESFKIIGKEALIGCLTGLIIAVVNFGWVMVEFNIPLLNVPPELKNTILNELGFSNIQYGYMLIAAIVSLSLFMGVFLSKLSASILPFIAKSLHLDPAFMAGPLVASIMDLCTLAIYFVICLTILDGINPGILPV